MKKYKRKLIISNRDDGFGERMCSLLNAMYISKILNFHFGFVWKNKVDSLLYQYKKTDRYLCCNDCIDKEEIFHSDFIKKFHYDTIPSSIIHSFFKMKGKSIYILKNKPYEYSFGHQSCQEDLSTIFSDVKERQYRKLLRKSWNEIQFSLNFRHIMLEAEKVAKMFEKGFVAIHIRSGDIVFEFKGYSRWLMFSAYKAVSFNLIASVIKYKLNYIENIIIFSDDTDSSKILKKYCDNKIFLAEEFLCDKHLSNDERSFFEIILMSKAQEIYHSGNSGFSRLACFIGVSRSICIYKYFSKIQQYNFILDNIDELRLSRQQKAYSYFMLFIFAREMKLSKKKQMFFLEKGYEEDKNNKVFILSQIEIYFSLCDYEKANQIIKEIVYKNEFMSFLEMLITKSYDLGCYDNFVLFHSYLLNMNGFLLKKYPYIALVSYLIAQDIYLNFKKLSNSYHHLHMLFLELLYQNQDIFQFLIDTHFYKLNIKFQKFSSKDYFDIMYLLKNNATVRVKQSLAYKIGYGFIGANGWVQRLYFFYHLNNVLLRHRTNIKEFKNFIKNKDKCLIKRNEGYYMELQRLRNYLSYQFGVEIIKAHNSFFRLYYICLPIKLLFIILKRRFRWK